MRAPAFRAPFARCYNALKLEYDEAGDASHLLADDRRFSGLRVVTSLNEATIFVEASTRPRQPQLEKFARQILCH